MSICNYILKLGQFSLGSFPVIMKEDLKLLDIDTGFTFRPVEPLSEKDREKLKEVLCSMQVL